MAVALRIARVWSGLLLAVSGCLMYAASSQRWSGACAWGQDEGTLCNRLQDHRYDIVLPGEPWEPVGVAAELAGCSLLALGLAFLALAPALTGRRPHLVTVVASAVVSLSLVDVGLATLRSGISGVVVRPLSGDLGVTGFLLALPVLLVVLAVQSRGWARAAAVLLFLATPVVAAFSYAVGSYDANPWWEAVSGILTAAGGACLLVAGAFSTRQRGAAVTSTAPGPRRPALLP